MKNQESPKLITKSVLPPKPTKFRFPFKQKSALPLSTSPTSTAPYGFFNLRKLGSKSSTPVHNQQRKSVTFNSDNMDWKKKITTDHTDVAYREAVTRLRTILSPKPQSQTASLLASPTKGSKISDVNISPRTYSSKPSVNLYDPHSTPPKKDRFASGFRSMFSKDAPLSAPTPLKTLNNQNYSSYMPITQTFGSSNECEDDLFGFIEKQGEYIAQLEKETQYSRNEMGNILDKVRDVISENEALHEKQKRDLLTSMIEQLDEKTDGYSSDSKKPKVKSNITSSNGNVIMESKVAELEAQLSQARRNLRLAQEEVLEVRKGKVIGSVADSQMGPNSAILNNLYANCDLHRADIENLVREKEDLLETMSKLKHMVSDLRDRESDAAKKVKNSLEIVEQMQMEKAQSDIETRRLKEELDRHQKRVRDMIQEHSRRLHEEKMQVEKKYRQEIDHLNNEMNQEMDSLTKARLDLERQKRVELDLKRELQQKSSTIDDLRQEMQIKMSHLQNELSHTLGHKSSVEQELINARLNCEKIERDGKQEAIRLQAEISGLRRRLEQMDSDAVKNQEIIAKLNENLSQMQRETSLAKIRLEGHIGSNPDMQDADVVSIIQSMEDKHSRDMTDLEQLIQVQNNLLEKLRSECKTLTDKLEETSRQYKKERTMLEGDRDKLAQFNKAAQEKCVELEQRVQFYSNSHEQMTGRLQKLEEDDKTRSDRIFQLLSKQSGLLKENQSLQSEVSQLKNKLGDFSSGNSNRNVN